MIINEKEVLYDMYNKCGELARYHMEAARVVFVCDRSLVEYHMNKVDKYIDIRWGLISLIKDGG